MILIVLVAILAGTTAYSLTKLNETKDSLQSVEQSNDTLKKENRKLLEANTNADKEIDKLTEKYDKINTELSKIKEKTNQDN